MGDLDEVKKEAVPVSGERVFKQWEQHVQRHKRVGPCLEDSRLCRGGYCGWSQVEGEEVVERH